MCAPLVKAVASKADRDDFDRLDVADRRLGLVERGLDGLVGAAVELPTSSMILMTRTDGRYATGSRKGAD
jgi:hypothetical protein